MVGAGREGRVTGAGRRRPLQAGPMAVKLAKQGVRRQASLGGTQIRQWGPWGRAGPADGVGSQVRLGVMTSS